MTITEKAAYIKGLAEGLSLDEDTKQNKIIKELIDLVSDMSLQIEDLDISFDGLCDVVDEIDHDLGELEEEVYGDYGCGCGDHDCDCGCCDEPYTLQCPKCGCEIGIEELSLTSDDVVCPNCNAKLELFSDDVDDKDVD